MMIITNQVMVDWLRVKSFRPKMDLSILSLFGYDYQGYTADEVWETGKQQQYFGVRGAFDGGTVWGGSALQPMGGSGPMMPHHMVDITGGLADYKLDEVASVVDTEHDKIGRIDLQVTIEKPGWWNQRTFFQQLQNMGLNVGWPTPSHDKDIGEMATVYIGSRKSSRFARIYVKKSGDGVPLLRFEFEYKLARANQVGNRVMRDRESAWRILWADLRDIRHPWIERALSAIFEGVEGEPVVVGMHRPDDKGKNWLIGLVLPTFERFINDHDDGREVAGMFQQAIDRMGNWPDVDEP
jgi:hypothetical protein